MCRISRLGLLRRLCGAILVVIYPCLVTSIFTAHASGVVHWSPAAGDCNLVAVAEFVSPIQLRIMDAPGERSVKRQVCMRDGSAAVQHAVSAHKRFSAILSRHRARGPILILGLHPAVYPHLRYLTFLLTPCESTVISHDDKIVRGRVGA